MESLIVDANKFHDCLQEDASMAIHVANEVKEMLGDYCDV